MAKKAKAGGDDAAEKKSPKMKIIIGVVGLAAAWKLGVIPIGQPKDDAGALGTTTTTAVVEGDTVEVGDAITVNLADTDVARYARVAVALVLNEHPSEATDEEHAAEAVVETHVTEATIPEAPHTDTTAAGTAETETVETEAVETETVETEAAAHKGAAAGKATSGGGGAEVDPVAAVEGRFPAVQNLVIVELRQWTYAQLTAPDALITLQARLTEQVQEIYPHHEVVRVVFTEFVVQ
jgi:flagellar basal body-associated protein FliL